MQPSDEECIFDMNVFTPLEDDSVNEVEDDINGIEDVDTIEDEDMHGALIEGETIQI